MGEENGRLSRKEATALFHTSNVNMLGERAHQARMRATNPTIVTYVVDRNINYSNICAAHCSFCAFKRNLLDEDAYVLSSDELYEKIEALVDVGGTQVLLQGGHHPKLPFSFYIDLLRGIKQRFDVDLHAFSAPEIVHFSRMYKMQTRETLERLREAGLNSIPGGGAEILSDRVRSEITRGKCLTREWLSVHEEAHTLGMRTTATMMFGQCGDD